MDPPIELNRYCDAILDCVYTYGKNRPVIFSSFNPQICIALHLKQPNFPVFFLCDAGDSPALDARSASIQGAIRFAKHLGLLGIVISSTPLIEEPNLINVIKSHGLILFTYGPGNNSVENAKLQTTLGVDAVIVDNVAHIGKGLSKREASPASPPSPSFFFLFFCWRQRRRCWRQQQQRGGSGTSRSGSTRADAGQQSHR